MVNKNKKVWKAMVKTSTDSVAPLSSKQLDTQGEIASPARYNLKVNTNKTRSCYQKSETECQSCGQ